jgi:ribosomal protein S27AE
MSDCPKCGTGLTMRTYSGKARWLAIQGGGLILFVLAVLGITIPLGLLHFVFARLWSRRMSAHCAKCGYFRMQKKA